MSPRKSSASTSFPGLQARLDSPAQLGRHLDALVGLDPRLGPVRERAGQVALRTGPKGFVGLIEVICGQQLSTFSAAAIWGRLIALEGASEPASFLGLEEPVLRAAMGVLAQRIVAPDGRVSPEAIAQAATRSGIGLEASLARGMPQPMDAKAGLLALRDALSKWLGDTPAAPAPQARTPGDAPPLKGLPLRAIAADPPSLPDAARDAGRLLHEQTDSAISRVKLMQLASLADPQTNSARPSSPSLRMELPFLIGHELVMAQMQVGRDGGSRREAAGKRGWSMRFALNFSATGEVGAEVGLLGRAVSVALWAAEPETAAATPEAA